MADEEQDLSWKKPEWATSGPKLRSTGKDVKSGNLAKPITNIRELVAKGEAPDFDKPEWTAEVNSKERAAMELAKPVTAATQNASLAFEKPEWTKTAAKERDAMELAKPTTAATQNASLAFEKPDWTKDKKLNSTKKGQALSSGGDIARPIGGIKHVEE